MRVIFTLVLVLSILRSYGQLTFYAVANDVNWNASGTWSTDGATPIVCAPCVAGTHYPGANNDAYTNGFRVYVPIGTSANCRDLYVDDSTPGGVTFFAPSSILTINGTLYSYSAAFTFPNPPQVANIIASRNQPGIIRFTGSNLGNALGALVNGDEIIIYWNALSPLNRLEFNLGTNTRSIGQIWTSDFSSVDNLPVTNSFVVNSGTLNFDETSVSDLRVNNTLTVASGAILNLPISARQNAALTSRITNLNINGTINLTGDNSFINSNTFTLGASGVLNVAYSDITGQTEGWWYQSARPSTFNINNASTISFNAGTGQYVYSRPYGNLILDGGAGTKTLSGPAAFTVNGDLTIDVGVTFNSAAATSVTLLGDVSNGGSWSPPQLVTFQGTATQVLSGNPITFGGGVDIGNSINTPATFLDIQTDMDVNGLLRVLTNATLDVNDYEVFLSGNLTTDGNIAYNNPFLGTFVFDGSTSFGGSVAPTLPGVNITGTVIAPPSNISVAGNFTNSGTFTAGSGTVTFNGTADQTISGVATFYNVIISNTGANGVSPLSTMNLGGTLTMSSSSSKFNANGNLVVLSTGVNSGGRIAELPSTTNFTGNVTIQRYIDGPDDWRYLSFPKQGATVEDLRDPTTFPVTGNFSDPSPADADVISPTAPSLYRWDGATQAWVPVGSGASMAATGLTNIGYAAYSYRTGNVTLSFSGSMYKGPAAVSLSSSGWNLVPNPYPSAIDWDNVNRTGLNSEMHIRTANLVFASYVAGGASTNAPFVGWTGEVATGQSFWVSSTGATSLTFEENDKTAGQYEFLRENEPENYFRLTLVSQTQKDEAVVWFPEGATDGFDDKFDAGKRRNGCETCANSGYLNLSSFTSDPQTDYAINGIPRISCNDRVGLRVRDVAPGAYTLKFSELDKLYLGYTIKLIDHFTNSEILAEEGLEYEFNVTADANSYGSGRFELELNTAVINTSTPPSFTDLKECEAENVKINLNAPQTGVKYQLWSATEAITDEVSSTGADITFVLSKDDLQQGTNLFTLKAATADGCYNHSFNNALEYYLEAPVSVTSVQGGEHCGEGSVTLEASGAPSNGYYNWYETSDATEPVFTSEEGSFITPALTKSKSYFVSVVNGSGCESTRSKVEANILYYDAPTIEVEGNTLISTEGAGYQWYKDGEILTGKTNRELQAMESGDYTVTVTTSEGCSISSEARSFVITGEADLIDMGVRIYPNPISSILKITMPPNFANDVTKMSVFDVRGSEIVTVTDKDVIDSGEVSMDFREKKSGQYILNIISGRKVIALRLVKR